MQYAFRHMSYRVGVHCVEGSSTPVFHCVRPAVVHGYGAVMTTWHEHFQTAALLLGSSPCFVPYLLRVVACVCLYSHFFVHCATIHLRAERWCVYVRVPCTSFGRLLTSAQMRVCYQKVAGQPSKGVFVCMLTASRAAPGAGLSQGRRGAS